jgi:hypothetical protein
MMQTHGKTLGRVMFGSLLALAIASVGCGFSEEKTEQQRKAFGQTCAAVAECESQQCAEHGRVCTKACVHDKECGDALVCRGLDTGTGMQCGKAEGSKVGSACQTAAECDHGLCVKKANAPSEPGFCSRTCQGPGECPDGYKICDSLADGANKMCLLGDDRIPIGERQQFVAPGQVVGPQTKPTASAASTASAAPTTSAAPAATASTAPPTAPPDAGAPPADAGANPRPSINLDGGRPRIKLELPKRTP